jgi:hypothetical protein
MSSINFESIDQNYPVAGQDNNSQGFRDNLPLSNQPLLLPKPKLPRWKLTQQN